MTLAMHDLIVTEGKHEVFGVGVPDRKRDVVLMKLAEPRIELEVIEHVVHPTHIPFEVEAQSTVLRGLGHHGPGGGFFSDRESAWEMLKQNVIGLLKEANGLRVFSAPVFVGQPFTVRP